ncbi:hypothetical protein L195_g039071, partial [Trifolium pratense]
MVYVYLPSNATRGVDNLQLQCLALKIINDIFGIREDMLNLSQPFTQLITPSAKEASSRSREVSLPMNESATLKRSDFAICGLALGWVLVSRSGNESNE